MAITRTIGNQYYQINCSLYCLLFYHQVDMYMVGKRHIIAHKYLVISTVVKLSMLFIF